MTHSGRSPVPYIYIGNGKDRGVAFGNMNWPDHRNRRSERYVLTKPPQGRILNLPLPQVSITGSRLVGVNTCTLIGGGMRRRQVGEVYDQIRAQFIQASSHKWGADPADAEDALQDIVVWFLGDIERYRRLTPETFRSRLWSVAETRMRDIYHSDRYRHAREGRWSQSS